jgi:DNA-binding MarR family transcriptional regulator
MEDRGLIERRKQVGNRRSLFVYFTEHGREVAEKMRVIFEEEDKAATEILSLEECESLNKMLEKICKKMVADSEEKKLK